MLMPKVYRLKNRYMRGTKLTEASFLTILRAFCDGEPAIFAAKHTANPKCGSQKVDIRSVRPIYSDLRRRLLSDELLSGELKAIIDNSPPAISPYWRQLRKCLLYCPGIWKEEWYRSAAEPYSTKHNPAYRIIDDMRIRKAVVYIVKDDQCADCGIRKDKHEHHAVIETLRARSSRMKGLPDIPHFRDHYFECLFRADMRAHQRFSKTQSLEDFFALFKKVLEANPL